MRSWSLIRNDPKCLTFSADFRVSHPNYCDDQTWALSLEGGDPPAVAISTSFGLRARRMRYFPRFIRKGSEISDPLTFHQAPVVRQILPNYCQVTYWPFDGVEVIADYYVAASHSLVGQLRFVNHNVLAEKFALEWAGQLNPLDVNAGLQVNQLGSNMTLSGLVEDLVLTCKFDQPTQRAKGPFPALAAEINLPPSSAREFTWQATAYPANLPREPEPAVAWQAALVRSQLQSQADQLDIETGNQNQDAVLALSQAQGYRLFFPSNDHLPRPSFVLSREPDQGYSRRGDGGDYPFLWNGQTSFDCLYLSSVLPGGAQTMRGLVENFLSTQGEDGQIEWKPGLAGRQTHRMAQPLLAALAWQVAQNDVEEDGWLGKIFPSLLRFYKAWRSPGGAEPVDQFPHWSNPIETALEDNPLYNRGNSCCDGADISMLDAPGLAAMLFNEAACLRKIAVRINQASELPWLEAEMERFHGLVQSTWDESSGLFLYQDSASHTTGQGGEIARLQGSTKISLRRTFRPPARVVYILEKSSIVTRAAIVHLTGTLPDGQTATEDISARAWTWAGQTGTAVSQYQFASLNRLETNGMEPDDELILKKLDTHRADISQLLPLWAGIASPDQVRRLAEETIPRLFLRESGLVSYVEDGTHPLDPSLHQVSLPWNALIVEGLLRNNCLDLARQIIEGWMKTVCACLQQNQAFYAHYHPQTGSAIGQRGHLHGLFPVSLYLEAVGIHTLSTNQAILSIAYHLPAPITVKYQGMEIVSEAGKITITYPSGQSAVLDRPGFHKVTLASPDRL